jgi:hypothetical protein
LDSENLVRKDWENYERENYERFQSSKLEGIILNQLLWLKWHQKSRPWSVPLKKVEKPKLYSRVILAPKTS